MRECVNPKIQIHDTCKAAVREAYHHGKEYFNEYLRIVNRALAMNECPMVQLSFAELEHRYLGTAFAAHVFPEGMDAQSEVSSEKLPIVDVSTENTTLTKNSDIMGVQDDSEEAHDSTLKEMDTYDQVDFTTSSMKRFYPVATIPWSGATVQGTRMAALYFPDLLLSIPHLVEMTNSFQYMHAGVEVEFRLNSTTFHYGAVMISWAPQVLRSVEEVTNFNDMWSSSCNNFSVLSANSQTTVRINIPWINVDNWLDLSLPMTDGNLSAAIGAIYLWVLVPLKLVGSATVPVLQISAQARFVEPTLAGYSLRTVPTDFLQYEAQGEQKKKSETGLISGITEDVSRIATKLSVFPLIGDYAAPLAKATSMASKFLSMVGLDKPTDMRALVRQTPTVNDGYAYGKGLDESNVLSFDPAASVANEVGIYGSIDYDRFDNYKLLPTMVATFSFSATTAPLSNFFQWPVSPTKVHTQDTSPGHTKYFPSHISNLAIKFASWNGGQKYKLDIYTSKMTSCRFRITWNPDATYVGSLPDNQAGDVISFIVDVCGDTQYEFTIPYLKPTPWSPVLFWTDNDIIVNNAGTNGMFFLQLLTPVVVSDNISDTSVYCVLYHSGAEDFRVMRLRDPKESYSPKYLGFAQSAKVEIESDVRKVFRRAFEPIIPAKSVHRSGVTIGQEVGSFSEYLHRYNLMSTLTSTLRYQLITPWNFGTTYSAPLFDRILRTFRYARGSMRLKIMFTGDTLHDYIDATHSYQSVWYLTTSGENLAITPTTDQTEAMVRGAAFEYSQFSPVISVTLPFYFEHNFYSHATAAKYSDELPAVLGYISAPNVAGNIMRSTGDDFSLGFPQAPIPYNS